VKGFTVANALRLFAALRSARALPPPADMAARTSLENLIFVCMHRQQLKFGGLTPNIPHLTTIKRKLAHLNNVFANAFLHDEEFQFLAHESQIEDVVEIDISHDICQHLVWHT
jgi:hypothetical protein